MSLLKHKCGGPVVINTMSRTKLVAPSFGISKAGIQNLTLDVDVNIEPFVPEFECSACHEQIQSAALGSTVFSSCQICGKSRRVDELSVYPAVSPVCSTCVEQIKGVSAGTVQPGKVSDRIFDYLRVFNLKDQSDAVSLESALRIPITI